MFREGRHAQKNKRRSKNMHRFFHRLFIDFPPQIDATSRKQQEKRPRAQKSTKINVWKVIFQQQIDFCSIFVVPLGPRGPPGTSREPPRIVRFFIHFQFRLKTGPDGPPGGGPGARGSPGHPQGTILGRFLVDFARQTSKKYRKMLQKHGKNYFKISKAT